jgi:hypothetical protein
MHSCPDCDQACYCRGDIEDHDTGDEYYWGCIHCLNRWEADIEDDPVILEPQLPSRKTTEAQTTD